MRKLPKKRVNWLRNLQSHWLYGCPSLHLRGWFLVWPSACQTWKMSWAHHAKLYNKNVTNLRGYIFVSKNSEYLVVKKTPKPRGIFNIYVEFVILYVCNVKNKNVRFCSDLVQSASPGYFAQIYDEKLHLQKMLRILIFFSFGVCSILHNLGPR